MAADVRTRWNEALRIIESQLPEDGEVCRDMRNWLDLVRAAGTVLGAPDSSVARVGLGRALDAVVDSVLITMAPPE